MDFKLLFLERAVKWLVGGDLFMFVSDSVNEFADAEVSGEDKRLAVQMLASEFFTKTSNTFINIAIEVAVLLLQARLSKEG